MPEFNKEITRETGFKKKYLIKVSFNSSCTHLKDCYQVKVFINAQIYDGWERVDLDKIMQLDKQKLIDLIPPTKQEIYECVLEAWKSWMPNFNM